MFIGLLAAAGLIAGAAAPAVAAPLAPLGKWGVDFGEAHCIAYRSFDTPGKPLMLHIKAPVLGDDLQLSFVTPGKGGDSAGEQLRGTWRIDEGVPAKVTVLKFQSKDGKRNVLMMNLPRSSLAPMLAKPAAMSLQIGAILGHAVQIQGLASLIKVLDDCVAGLRQRWNVNDQLIADYAARLAAPKGTKIPAVEPRDGGKPAKLRSLARLFSSNDYPMQPLMEGDDGTVRAVLLIDEAGKVADCTLTKTSGVAALDAQACAVVRERARYSPALDAAGKPRRDVDTFTVHWVLP
jgi:TonB family protein